MGSAGVIIAMPGVASAINNNPPGNPTSPAISYEGDCTTALQAGTVAPFATTLDGNTSIDTGAPTGATFGFSGTATTTIVGAFVANLFTALGGLAASPTLGMQWTETIGSTDGNATGSYTYNSPTFTDVPDGGGTVKKVTWTNASTTLTGNFSAAAVGDGLATADPVGIPQGATITAINTTKSATISEPTTAASTASTEVGYGANTTFTDPALNTGTVFTTNGANGETAGVGVTSITVFKVTAALLLTFGGTPGDGAANCLETGYDAGGVSAPAQTCGATPPCATAPAFPNDTTTALPSLSPLEFPPAAYVDLQSSDTVPGAPTIGTATAGNASATVNWTAPADDGGSAITGYVITPFIGATAQTPIDVGNVTTDDVTGLTNGTAYTFEVAATNAIGTGADSAASNSVTPEAPTVPGAPTIGTATAGNASATVNWTAPASDGGSPITGYVITPSSGPPVDVGNVTSDDVTGLTIGTAYTFTVAATNAVGTGPASAASNAVTPTSPPPPPPPPPPPASAAGYWMVTSNGSVYPQGSVSSHGSTASLTLNSPIVGAAATQDGQGYWLVAADGGVFAYGDAVFYGSMGGSPLNSPIVGMAATPDGKGYWLVGADGGVFAFGDAVFAGSAGGTRLNAPVVGIASDGSDGGYWLVAADGGVFTYGNASFDGSAGGTHLNAPVVGIAGAPGGEGYWLVGRDGGVFTYGAATFLGSAVGDTSGVSVLGIAAAPGGYLLTSANGGVFAFGTPFQGSEAGNLTTAYTPVVAIIS
jgi:hypothetical protein